MSELTVPKVWRLAPLGPEARRLVGTAHPGELADEVQRMQPLEIERALIDLAVRLGGLEAELTTRGVAFSDLARGERFDA